jgi:tetratricopeptide (TPR) repeat protein
MEVLPSDSAERRLALAQLGWAIFLAGDAARSEALLGRTREDALAAGDQRAAAWAAIGLIYLRNSLKAAGGAEILAEAEELRDTFRALGDREGADQAELVAAMSLFFLGRAAEAATRAHAIAAAPDVTPLNVADGQRWEGAASVFGPSPTSVTIALIRGRQQDQYAPGSDLGVARMLTLQGLYDEARESAQQAGRSLEQLGDRMLLSQFEEVLGMIALAAGDIEEASLRLRSSYDAKVAMGDVGFSSTTAVNLAEARLEAGDWIEAERFAAIALDTSATDDIASQSGGKAILGRVRAHQGDFDAAEALAAEAVAIMAATDYLDWHATVLVHQAHVFRAAGKTDAAVESLRHAEELYRQKEATARVAEVEALLAEWSAG